MGYDDYSYEDTAGEDVLGADEVLGALLKLPALRRLASARGKQPVMIPRRPPWRAGLAPGVPMPGQGRELLPLTPDLAGGIFAAATPNINFIGRPQRPFRGERLVTRVTRSAGAGAVNILCNTLFVGTQPQQAQIQAFDVEQFGPTAFGLELVMSQAQPGVEIQLRCSGSIAVPAGETVAVSMFLLGHTVR
jgi:hypothetical protein